MIVTHQFRLVFLASAMLLAEILTPTSVMAQGTMSTTTRHEKPWYRSFDEGVGPNFLVVGFGTDRGQLSVSNSLTFDADRGFLDVDDTARPVDSGAFSVVGIDTQLYTGDIHMSAVINPAGLPARDPIPDETGSDAPPHEVAMGLFAGGNFLNSELYAGGLDFDSGKLFLLRLSGGYLYPEDAMLGEDSIADAIPDFRSRSFYIEFNIANRIQLDSGSEAAEMNVELFDRVGGDRLSSLTFLEYPLRDGYTGVFASFRDINLSPYYPTLVASFDDVRLVPEPTVGTLASLFMLVGCFYVGRRPRCD